MLTTTPPSTTWNNLSSAEKKATRFAFQLNSKLTIDQINTIFQKTSPENISKIVNSGRHVFSLFLNDQQQQQQNINENSFSSSQTISSYLKSEVWDSEDQNKNNNNQEDCSPFFYFFLILTYLENPYSVIILPNNQKSSLRLASNSSSESADGVHKVLEFYVAWVKSNRKGDESNEENKNDNNDEKEPEPAQPASTIQNDENENRSKNTTDSNTKNKNDNDDDEEQFDFINDDLESLPQQSMSSAHQQQNALVLSEGEEGSFGHSSQTQQQHTIQQPPRAFLTVEQFNQERKTNNNALAISSIVRVEYFGGRKEQITSFGRFCCGGKRKDPTGNPRLTNASNLGHLPSCPFHPDHNYSNDQALQLLLQSAAAGEQKHVHVGKLVEKRTTKSLAVKSHPIAVWSCCGREAVSTDMFCSYKYNPETSNGCHVVDSLGATVGDVATTTSAEANDYSSALNKL